MISYEDALAQVREAEWMGNPSNSPECLTCGHIGFHYPADTARDYGHVYSNLGLAEWKNTLICEFCFDKLTADPSMSPEEQKAHRLQAIEDYENAQFREQMRGLDLF